MRICIKVIANAKRNLVDSSGAVWTVYCRARAVDGKANQAICAQLAAYFDVRKNQIEITKGLKSRYKTISIEGI